MRGRDGGDQRDVAHDEVTLAVRRGHAHGAARHLGAALGEEPRGVRMRLVLERGDGRAVIVVAHDPLEDHDRAVRRIAHGRPRSRSASSGSLLIMRAAAAICSTQVGEQVAEHRQPVLDAALRPGQVHDERAAGASRPARG